MLRILFVIAVSSSLGACGFTAYGDHARDTVRVQGARAADAGLANSEWYWCNAVTSGSVYRRYGAADDLMKARERVCAFNRLQQIPTN